MSKSLSLLLFFRQPAYVVRRLMMSLFFWDERHPLCFPCKVWLTSELGCEAIAFVSVPGEIVGCGDVIESVAEEFSMSCCAEEAFVA